MASGYITRDIHFLRKLVVILVILLIAITGAELSIVSHNSNVTNLQPQGYLQIYKNGVLIGQGKDAISEDMFIMMSIKLFNLTSGYAFNNLQSNWYGSNAAANGCHTYNKNGLIDQPNTFSATTRCEASALELTTDTVSVSTNQQTCGGGAAILNSNGFSPVKGTLSWTGASGGGSTVPNTLTVTGTWTASGTQNAINKVCLALWNDVANTFVTPFNCVFTNSATCEVLAVDAFPSGAVSFTSGQVLTIVWTFIM